MFVLTYSLTTHKVVSCHPYIFRSGKVRQPKINVLTTGYVHPGTDWLFKPALAK